MTARPFRAAAGGAVSLERRLPQKPQVRPVHSPDRIALARIEPLWRGDAAGGADDCARARLRRVVELVGGVGPSLLRSKRAGAGVGDRNDVADLLSGAGVTD